MTITLTPEQKAWLEARVARGDFPSIEAAARQLIDERIAEHAIDEEDDLSWAKAAVEEGLAALERGDVMSLEEHRSRNAERLAQVKR